MRLIDWVFGRNSRPGETSGDRVGQSYDNHVRDLSGLPPRKKAWFIDLDGTKHYHDLDIHDDTPSQEVRVRHYRMSGEIEEKVYEYDKVDSKGYLIYYQI